MLVNTTMAELSDLTFRTAFIVYIVALIMAFIYYGRVNSIIEARREALAEKKVLVGAGGPEVVEKHKPDEDMIANARKWAGMTQALVWVGVALHLVAFVTRGLAAGRFPLGNLYEYILFMTAVIMVVAAVVVQRKNWHTVWPWLLFPMVIAMFLNSTVFHMQAAPVVPALQSYWLPVHVSSAAIGASVGLVSGAFALLYLLRMRQPRGEEHGFLGAIARPLPDAKTLDQIAYKTAVVTLPLFGIGVVFGAIWAEVAWGSFWGWDAKETVSMITWILYAAYLHARATAGWKSTAAAWINVFAMAMTIFNMTYVNTVIAGLHSYAGLN